ncbi:MAG: SIMPL domain-containing protein [Nocardioides sp.]
MRTVTVTGHGIAPVTPDSAVVRVTAVHRAPTLAEALAGASSAGAAVTSVARAHVDAARLSSRELSVWPAHDHEGRQSGFEARHGYTVTCSDLDVAGALVTELATQVGDRLQVEGVSLEVSDTSAAVTAAREAAYADARARAEHLAGLADVSLGDVQSLVEGAGAVPMARGFEAMAKGDVVLEPGEGSLGQSLTVTWAIL